jgi:hypothetical protein
MDTPVLQQFREEFWRCLLVPPLVHQHIEDFAFIIDGPPQVLFRPPIRTTISSRCQRPVRQGPVLRALPAKSRPNFCVQNRMVSWLTAIPRSAMRSSTSRKLGVKRKYSQALWPLTSAGNRWRAWEVGFIHCHPQLKPKHQSLLSHICPWRRRLTLINPSIPDTKVRTSPKLTSSAMEIVLREQIAHFITLP